MNPGNDAAPVRLHRTEAATKLTSEVGGNSTLAVPHRRNGRSAGRRYIEVLNYQQVVYRHGDRRGLPWTKLYQSLLDSLPYRSLTKPQRSDYIDMLLLANKYNNLVPDDADELRFALHLRADEELPDVQGLVDAGFLRRASAGKAAAKHRTVTARPPRQMEKENENKTKTNIEKKIETPAPVMHVHTPGKCLQCSEQAAPGVAYCHLHYGQVLRRANQAAAS